MSLRGFRAAVCLLAAGAAVFAACSQAGTVASPGGSEDASTSDVGSAGDAPTSDATDGATGSGDAEGGSFHDTGASLDAGPAFDGDCGLGASGEPVELRCTGLYADWGSKTIAPGVQEFTPGLQLWSDGASKTRWIQLPAGQKIDTSSMDEWTFPVGTKLWKEFRVPVADAAAPVRIETRLLWKQSAGTWYRTTYRWSDDGQTTATELTAGQLDANGAGYEVPSKYECNDCHQGRLDGVLGFEAVGLAAPGATGITLQGLVEAGVLTVPPTGPIAIPGDAVEIAALGWLHVNCGTACHNGGNGLGGPSGFLMRLDVAKLGSVQATDTYTTGWNQLSATYTIPTATATYRFHACDVGSSAAYYRASLRDGINGVNFGNQMPPLDTHVVDDAGLAILSAWINEGCSDGGDGG